MIGRAAALLLAVAATLAEISPAGAQSRVAAGDRLPIFDTHIHYSRDAWALYPPAAVLAKLDDAGVAWALVSSTPDDGTLMLNAANARRVVPELRPYHGGLHTGNWFGAPRVVDYLQTRLANGDYRGIGELHLLAADHVRTPTVRRVVALAVAHDIPLHVHGDAAVVAALFALDPTLKILWAHAGMSEPPDVVGALLDRYERLWTEVSFRAGDIAPGGRLAEAWRALFARHPDRFMIGSDTYINDRWQNYGGLIAEHRRWLGQLPAATAAAIAHANAARLFAVAVPEP